MTKRYIPLTAATMALALMVYAPSALAQSAGASCRAAGELGSFLLFCVIGFIDGVLVPLIFALAFIVFLWGVYSTFIAGAANEEKRKEGQKLVMYGLIGFFLMLSIWGIIHLLLNTFGLRSSTRPDYPTFGPPSSGGSVNKTSDFFGGGSGGTIQYDQNGCPPGFSDVGDGAGCQPD